MFDTCPGRRTPRKFWKGFTPTSEKRCARVWEFGGWVHAHVVDWRERAEKPKKVQQSSWVVAKGQADSWGASLIPPCLKPGSC